MIDCSQLSAQLAAASQELSQLPERQQDVIAYCQAETGGGRGADPKAYRACLQWVPLHRQELLHQTIPTLQREIAYCNLLIGNPGPGTWAITATVDSGNTIVPDYTGTLRIDSWDIGTGVLGGRIEIPKQSGDFPGAWNYIQATLQVYTLEMKIIMPGEGLIYDGTLNAGTGLITGTLAGPFVHNQIPSWSAKKL